MRKLEQAKKIYENIEIPTQFNDRVMETLKRKKEATKMKLFYRSMKITGIAAAAALCVFVAGLNTNKAFAQAMSEIPILGAVANVLTVRSYETVEDSLHITVKMPEISVSGEGANKEYAEQLNQKIEEKIDTYVEEATERLKEYKKAFFEEGGTAEEWGDREMEIIVDYEVKYQSGPIASVAITVGEYSVFAYEQHYCYNINVEKGKELTLEELLGEDYIKIANESIKSQIEERTKKDSNQMYFTEEEKFQTIDEHTQFYINKEEKPVVIFQEYEIAPGYMGMQEFVIDKEKE